MTSAQTAWVLLRLRGSHQQYQHPARRGIDTIPCGGKLNRDVPQGTLNSVLRQAGLK